MKTTVETPVEAGRNQVRDARNDPADIEQWNRARDDWHRTRSTVDLPEGGSFTSRVEARDGCEGFDLEGTCTRIVPRQAIEYRLSDGREDQGGLPSSTPSAFGPALLVPERPCAYLARASGPPGAHREDDETRPRQAIGSRPVSRAETGVRAGGGWLAVASLLFVGVLAFHGPVASERPRQSCAGGDRRC